MYIGTTLLELRKERKIKQKVVAKKLKVSAAFVCQIENNEKPTPGWVIEKLSDLYKVSINITQSFSEGKMEQKLEILG